MADVNANIGVHIDTSAALAQLKNLQRQLSAFHSSIAKNSAASAAAQKNLQTNLLNSINATGKFSAQMGTVRTSTESFTHALETNKLSMREYFRFAGGSTKTFGRLFKQEFDTIGKVAQERVKTMQTQFIKMGRDASGAMQAMAIRPTTLNMNDYATKTALAAQKQALFNQLMRQGSTNLLNFGKNTQWAGRQLMVGFTVPLALFGTMAAKTFMDLEAQAVKFRRVYGEMFTTTEETTKALSDIQQIAKEFTKYGIEVSKTMEMAASAAAMGKMGADLTAQVVEATRLAVLGAVEQEESLKTTISLTNTFGISAENLASKIDFLNAVENQTVVAIEDLTIAIPKAGPVVKQLGGDVEDLAFFLTAMKEGGINASEGANALKSGLASLINPTEKASKMLEGFGISINTIVESNQGNIRQTVIDFARALDTLDPLNRARAIEQLFGKFQFSRLSTLFQNVVKDGTQASRVLELAGSSMEQLAILSERELKTLEDAVGVQFRSTVEELKLAIAPIGKTFLEAVTPIIRIVGDLLEKFNGLSDGTKKFLVVATTVVGVIGPVLLMTFGLLANGVANIIKLFLAMRIGFLKLGGNSKILAQQTDYLNSEQMEAATVATSLNQAHTRLTQSFTAEASAVRLLRQAYIDATVAAANFARANPGMMMPGRGGAPKKFARGATYVPGTGNKDNVPAVLTPGEAVIPRDVAQDPMFQPIIDAMVNGNLQGFNDGTGNVQPFANSPQFQPKMDLSGPSSQVLNTNPGQVNNLVLGKPAFTESNEAFAARSAALLERMNARKNKPEAPTGKTIFAHAVDNRVLTGSNVPASMQAGGFTKATAFSAIGFDLSPSVNSRLISGTVPVSEYLREIRSPLSTQTMTSRLIDLGASPREAARVTELMKNNLIKSLDPLPKTQLIGDKDIYSRMGNLKTGILGGMVAKSRGGTFGNAVKQLYASTTFSPSGKSSVTMNSTAPIGAVIDAIKKTKTSQAVLRPLEALRKMDPNYRVPVRLDAGGNITAYDRPEISKKTGQITSTRNVGVLSGDRFVVGRQQRGGGRKLTVSKRARQLASEQLLGTTKTGVVSGQTGTAKPATTSVTGGAPSDRRVVGVGKGEAVLNKDTTSALKGGRTAFIPGLGRIRIAGAEQGIPTGQKTGSTTVGAVSQSAQLSRAQLIAATEKISLNEAKRRIAAEAKLTNAINESTKAQITTKEKLTQFSSKAGMGIGAMSGLTIAASFAGGKVGEMAQTIMPFVFGLQGIVMLLPLLANPWVAAIAAIALVGGVMFKMAKDIEKARQEGIGLAQAMSMTSSKLNALSVITGSVSASEEANRRRQNIVSGTSDAQRQFGQNALESDVGKQILADIETQSKSGKSIKEISQNLANNLAIAVAQGAVTTSQARSIAAALGEQLGSYEIPALVSGKLVSLLGPNGENLASDPLQVTLEIQRESMQRQADSFKTAIEGAISVSTGPNALAKIASVGMVAAGSVVAGASLIGAPFTAGGSTLGLPVASGMIASGLALGGAGIVDENKRKAVNVKLAAAAVELGIQEVAQNQGLVDSLNRQYDLKLKSAKTEAEIKTIQDERKAGIDKLNASNADALDLLVSQRGLLGEEAFTKGIKAAADAMYKEGPMAVFKDQAVEELNKLKNSKFKTQLQIGLASGQVSPAVITKILSTAAGNKGFKTSFNLLVNKQGLADAALLAELLPTQGATAETRSLMIDYVNNNKEDFETDIQAVSFLNQINPTYGITLDLKANGVQQLVTATNSLKSIKLLPDQLTKEVVADLAKKNPEEWKAFYDQWSVLSEGKDFVNKNLKVSFDIVSNDPNFVGFGSAAGKSAAEIIAKGGIISGSLTGVIPPDDTKETKTRDTTLDDILNRLKMVRKASINATGGINQLLKVTGGKGLINFGGVMQSLMAQKPGAMNREFLDFINQMDDKTRKTYMTIKNGQPILTKQGKALKEAFDEAVIGEYQLTQSQTIDSTKAQFKAFNKLKAAGVSAAQAIEMVADAELAVAINGKDISSEELVKMAKRAKTAAQAVKDLQQTLNMQTREGQFTIFKESFDEAMDYFDAQEALVEQERMATEEYKNFTKQIDIQTAAIDAAEKVISDYQDKIGNLQYELEHNTVYGSRIIDNLNAQVDALNRSAEINFDRPLANLSDESSILSNTLSLIDREEGKINEKFDAQEQALSKISQINSEIASKEKQRLTLADALSQGDISAAAAAAQEMRSTAAEAASRRSSGVLAAAREAEIDAVSVSGMRRVQIEERQFQIGQRTFALEQDRQKIEASIQIIQDQIYAKELLREPINKTIRDYQFEIDKAQRDSLAPAQEALNKATLARDQYEKQTEALIKTIDYQGQTKDQWIIINTELTAVESKIKAVENETSKSAKNTAAILASWQALKSKTITLTENVNRIITTTNLVNTVYTSSKGSGGGGSTSQFKAYGGKIMSMNYGGMVPKYMAVGGAVGSDTVPAMLTPGEFVMNKAATKRFGPMLNQMNNSKFPSMIEDMTPAVYSSNNSSIVAPTITSVATTVADNSSTMYNYNIGISVPQSNASSNDIARAVIGQIKYVDSQRIRGQK